jgi:hypothetical protein
VERHGAPVGRASWIVPMAVGVSILLSSPGSVLAASPEDTRQVAEPAAATLCVADAETLCLQRNRFKVQGTYLLENNQGSGAISFAKRTEVSGTFTFNEPSDVQAVVKVLNTCGGFNDRFWVFIGALTNQQVNLKVTDMKTGAVKTYFNPLRNPFQPIQDLDAFATCP